MKKVVFVLAIAALAAAAAYGYRYSTLSNEQITVSKWLATSFDGVRSIHVQGKHGSYMLNATKDGWQAQVPGVSWNVVARAVPEKVAEYLRVLSALEPHRSIGGFDQGGPEEYGLDDPELKIIVTFSKAGAEPVTVKLTASGDVVYGWNSSSPGLVYEFGKEPLEALSQAAPSFLDTKVFQFDEEKVTKLQLVQPFGSSWLVEKRKEGYYFALPGYLQDKPASDSALKLYIHSLAILKANSLVLEPVETDKRLPALTIKLWTAGEKEPVSVEFFSIKDDPGSYLGKSSWLTVPFILDAQSVGQLLKSAFDVQGRTVIKLDLGLVNQLIVSHGDKRYGMVRGEQGWMLDDGKKILPGIDMFLWRFTELQFEALPLNSLPTTAIKLMQCTLADKSGKILKELTFYADPKLPQGQCWMKNGGGMYYPVSSRLLKDLQGMFPSGSAGSGA